MLRQLLPALAAVGFLLATSPAQAKDREVVLPADATLTQLVSESLRARPELAKARAIVRAEKERAPQAGALPDPMLQVGIQNDGFGSIEIGQMESSYVSLMVSQTFPWPGKRRLGQEVAELGSQQAQAAVSRVRLSTEAEVRRAYLDLLLVRDRLALLRNLDSTWRSSLGVALARYEAGTGSQSDVLRAQLELTRIEQRHFALRSEEQARVQALNRLRNHPLDEPIETSSHIRDLPNLTAYKDSFSAEHALRRSPELAAAKVAVTRAGRSVALAEKSYYPDLTVGAGIMYRGALPPMWQVTVAAPLPIFSGSKQGRAVRENRAWSTAAEQETSAIEQALRLRTAERRTAFVALLQTIELYEKGLLVQSAATSESTLSQYMVGKVTFASVLEANVGLINDQEGYLQALADAHRLLIAEAEISASPVAMPPASGGYAAMPGAGTSAMGTSGGSSPAGPAAMPGSAGSSAGM